MKHEAQGDPMFVIYIALYNEEYDFKRRVSAVLLDEVLDGTTSYRRTPYTSPRGAKTLIFRSRNASPHTAMKMTSEEVFDPTVICAVQSEYVP